MTFADSWILDSGFETEMTLTIDSAYFAPDANFGGNTVLNLVGHTPEGDTRTRIYALGGDWESTDGGNTIVHAGGKKRINQSSNYGHFIAAALALPGFGDYLKEKGDATDARVWVDLTLDLKEQEIVRGGVNRNTGDPMKPSRVMLPVAYRLPEQQQLPLVAPTQNGPSPADLLRARAAAAAPTSSVFDQLSALARTTDTFDAFVEAAAAIPSVLEDETIVADVVDASPAGFYARVRTL